MVEQGGQMKLKVDIKENFWSGLLSYKRRETKACFLINTNFGLSSTISMLAPVL
jgi:hypothetical protein